jgi:23S rRNA (cytidine2498-2'-O)-methyltransferase
LLAERGLDVVAIDPAALAPQGAHHPRVTHLRVRAEDAELGSETFDLLTNDMVMDPADSALEMVGLAPVLRHGGLAVMTLKLPYRQPWPSIGALARSWSASTTCCPCATSHTTVRRSLPS